MPKDLHAISRALNYPFQWEDAPTEYALLVTEMLPCGKVRQAVTLKAINDMEPVSIGMKVPVIGAGDRLLVVVVAEVMKGGEYSQSASACNLLRSVSLYH